MGLIFDKPEYIFRPLQLWRRLIRTRPPVVKEQILRLPWGHELAVQINETIGHSLWHLGIYDLAVSEALWRLTETGETVADIGANVGYVTSLLAKKAGREGQVWAFEPHPLLFARLQKNVQGWPKGSCAEVHCYPKAVSDVTGRDELMIPKDFAANTGTAFLRGADNQAPTVDKVAVELTTLKNTCETLGSIPSVIKIDTEGNEAKVLAGAAPLLAQGKVRDIIFEDHGTYPTPAMQELLRHGYTLFRVQKNFLGPSLENPVLQPAKGNWEPVSYLATRDGVRAQNKMRPRGWQVLAARG